MTKTNGKNRNGHTGAGRPAKIVIDPALVDRIERLVRIPTFPEVAARSVGIHPATFYRYMQQGADHVCDPDDKTRVVVDCQRDGHEYREFRERIERARSDGEIALTGIIRSAATGLRYRKHVRDCLDPQPGVANTCQCPIVTEAPNWFAAARMLESIAKNRWLRTERVEHTGEGGGPVQVESPAARIIKQTDKIAARIFSQMEEGDGNGKVG